MGSNSRPACHRCTQIKQACDGGEPYARCQRLCLPCRPRDCGSSATQQAGNLPKARIRRARTGCFRCKCRKKKCDEVKPRCGDCRRLNYFCLWPPERPKDGSTLDQCGSSLVARCESSLSTYSPQLMPRLDSDEMNLLEYYTIKVSSLLCRSVSVCNPYNIYLIPIAQSSDLVMHCILALSANHQRQLQLPLGCKSEYYKQKATRSLVKLLPQVDTDESNTLIAFVSSLLLCMMELFDGTSEEWQIHLKGAKLLTALVSQQQDDRMDSQRKFLVRLARFLGSVVTKSTCKFPLMDEDEQETATLVTLTAFPDDIDWAIYGIPKEWFHLVDVVNSLANKHKPWANCVSEETAFWGEASGIEKCIERLSYGNDILSWAPRDAGLVNNDDVVHATIAYECAIKLRLHLIVKSYDLKDARVVTYVEGILDSVRNIPCGSALELCLVYPLVIAGGVCWTKEQCGMIEGRLFLMESRCGFRYICKARERVKGIWTARDQVEGASTMSNRACTCHERMPRLGIF